MEAEGGEVTDFFKKLGVAAIKIYPGQSLKGGGKIVIRGPHTHIEQVVESLEIDHKPVSEAAGRAEVSKIHP